MMEYAGIETDHLWDARLGEMIVNHRWVGKSNLAKIHPPHHEILSGEVSVAKDKITMRDLHLRVVDFEGMYWIVTRDRWYTPAYKVLHRTIRSLEMLKSCLIVILSIWDLADYNPGALPSWRDIKWFNKKEAD